MKTRSDSGQLSIIYPSHGSAFHEELARRLAIACLENGWRAPLRPSTDVQGMDPNHLTGENVLIVSPWECTYGISDKEEFFSQLSTARKRIMVLAEAVEIKWFERPFRLPLNYDMLIDVGFVSQKEKLWDFRVPYRFLFNGATRQEQRTITQEVPSDRPVPWAFVGHYREARIKVAAELLERLDPRGFVFLPSAGGVRRGEGMINPSSLASILSKTKYYIWSSHHEFTYYESFRFREAVLAGAVPCKVDDRANWKHLRIPGIFPSVEALCSSIRDKSFLSMQDSAKEFYLSRGRLAEHLRKVLEDV